MKFGADVQRPPLTSADEHDDQISEDSLDEDTHHGRGRPATVYDAVAGRLKNKDYRTETNEMPSGPYTKHSTKETSFAPDEVLFRRRDAPERYAEHDIYFSHERDLPSCGQGVLPESDLLKTIHSYSSHFYKTSRRHVSHQDERNIDERTMDETALLAFGILLEEAGKEVLGRHGDLVFTEAGEAPGITSGDDEGARQSAQISIGYQEVGPRVTPRKRRRAANSDAPSDG